LEIRLAASNVRNAPHAASALEAAYHALGKAR
jgi:hypothetical protein